jgi:hypothetical protein
MLQIKCSCGRIAEVRHRRNGKKLAYIHCVNKCSGLVGASRAAEIQAQASEDIGVKGEFFKSVSNNSSETVQDKQKSDFKPEPNDLPENLESGIKIESEEFEAGSPKQGGFLKVVFGIFGAAVFGGGIYQLSKLRG